MPLLTFDQAITHAEGPLSLLMGNGFSRSLRDDIFNYANLLEKANFAARDPILHSIFKRLDTYDFEAVMRALESTEIVLEAYGGHTDLLQQIREDQGLLKDALVSAISRTHPERPHDITPSQFTAVRNFLSKFREIFTVNYDLLFYWARNQDDLPPAGYTTDDGFRAGLTWQDHGTDQNIYFLHGGLHLYEGEPSVKKLAHVGREVAIIDQVRENLDIGKFPLCVSEPTSVKKHKRIERNPYLNYCYRALRDLDGTLLILGHSMDENDNHIFEQIKQSRVTRILVSIHGDESTTANARTRANAQAFLSKGSRVVEFFDAQTAPVWG